MKVNNSSWFVLIPDHKCWASKRGRTVKGDGLNPARKEIVAGGGAKWLKKTSKYQIDSAFLCMVMKLGKTVRVFLTIPEGQGPWIWFRVV